MEEIVGLGDKLAMVSEGEEDTEDDTHRWIMVPCLEIAYKGRGADLLGKIMNLVLDVLMRNAFQMEML